MKREQDMSLIYLEEALFSFFRTFFLFQQQQFDEFNV